MGSWSVTIVVLCCIMTKHMDLSNRTAFDEPLRDSVGNRRPVDSFLEVLSNILRIGRRSLDQQLDQNIRPVLLATGQISSTVRTLRFTLHRTRHLSVSTSIANSQCHSSDVSSRNEEIKHGETIAICRIGGKRDRIVKVSVAFHQLHL